MTIILLPSWVIFPLDPLSRFTLILYYSECVLVNRRKEGVVCFSIKKDTGNRMLEITIGLFAIICVLVYYFLTSTYDHWQKKGIKFVKPVPLFGSMSRMLTLREHMSEFYCRVYNQFKNEKFVGIYRIRAPVLVFHDTELIKNILIKDFSHFIDHGMKVDETTNPLQARNLFLMEGQKWKDMRAKLTPTFTSGRMKAMFPLVLECVTRLEKFVEGIADSGQDVDIKDLLARYTTDVIGSCAFGIKCDSINDPNNEFRVMGRQMFHSNLFLALKRVIVLASPQISRLLRISNTPESVNDFFRTLVRNVMAARAKTGETRKDFIQLLMEIKEKGSISDPNESEEIVHKNGAESHQTGTKFTDDDITAQALVFFIAGFETSSTALTFALFELARRPDLQRTAKRHIEEVLERFDGQLTYQSIQEMTYLDWILQESLRKYPPLSMLPRICTKNYVIPGTDIVLEEGTHIVIPIHAIHNDPTHFPDPETFNPDRFSEETTANQNLFLAFGEGPRQCIGLRFAKMQSKLALAMLLRKFEVQPNSKTKYPLTMDPGQFLMVSKEDIILKIATAQE